MTLRDGARSTNFETLATPARELTARAGVQACGGNCDVDVDRKAEINVTPPD